MGTAIVNKGNYYELPIINENITHVVFGEHLYLCSGDYELRINHYFIWDEYNHQKVIDIGDKEAWIKMSEILFKKVVDAFFDIDGNVHLGFEDGDCIEVNELCRIDFDPHLEYWHFIDSGKILAYESSRRTIYVE